MAVLFVDVCDSTAYFERFGEVAGHRMVQRGLELVRRAVEARGGRFTRVVGDGLLTAFDDAAALVATSVAMQIELERSGEDGDIRSRIRIHCGGHHGPIVVDESGELFGEVANVASRIQALAGPDQIYVTAALVAELAEAERAITRRIGMFPVRGKRAEVEVHEVLWRRDDATEIRRFSPLTPRGALELSLESRTIVVEIGSERRITLGRDAANDLCVDDPAASRAHAEIFARGSEWYLEDHSTNGTYLKPGRRRPHFFRREERILEGAGRIFLGRDGGPPIDYRVVPGGT